MKNTLNTLLGVLGAIAYALILAPIIVWIMVSERLDENRKAKGK